MSQVILLSCAKVHPSSALFSFPVRRHSSSPASTICKGADPHNPLQQQGPMGTHALLAYPHLQINHCHPGSSLRLLRNSQSRFVEFKFNLLITCVAHPSIQFLTEMKACIHGNSPRFTRMEGCGRDVRGRSCHRQSHCFQESW